MKIKALFNEHNFMIRINTLSSSEFFDLREEYEGSMNRIRNKKRVNVIAICEAIIKSGYDYELVLYDQENEDQHQDSDTAMIMFPLMINQEEYIEQLRERFVDKKVRVYLLRDDEAGEYNLSVSLMPEICESGCERLKDVIDHQDHIEFVFYNDEKTYELWIHNIDETSNAQIVESLKHMIGTDVFLDLAENGRILNVFAANRMEDGNAGYVRILYTDFEYNEFVC